MSTYNLLQSKLFEISGKKWTKLSASETKIWFPEALNETDEWFIFQLENKTSKVSSDCR